MSMFKPGDRIVITVAGSLFADTRVGELGTVYEIPYYLNEKMNGTRLKISLDRLKKYNIENNEVYNYIVETTSVKKLITEEYLTS